MRWSVYPAFLIDVQITELFMAKAGWKRCFQGTIQREKDSNGEPILHSKIYVKDSKLDCVIFAMANNQDTHGNMLDEIVVLILDKGLHEYPGKTIKIAGTDLFLN
jgi:hypothetical protein